MKFLFKANPLSLITFNKNRLNKILIKKKIIRLIHKRFSTPIKFSPFKNHIHNNQCY